MRLYHPAFATNDGIVEVFPQDIMFGRREHVNVGDVLEKIGEAVAAARLAGNMGRVEIPFASDSVYGLGPMFGRSSSSMPEAREFEVHNRPPPRDMCH